MNFKRFLVLFSLLFGVGAILFILYRSDRIVSIYNGFGVTIPKEYPIVGIDVSHHQGKINFEAAVSMGTTDDSLQFVYIKATEGTNFKDSHYDHNAEGFAALKMKYGFYHYYQPNKSAKKQALFYCQVVKGYNFKLIPVVDIEVIGSLKKKALVDSLTVFINDVEQILESRPMIYTYVSFYEDYIRSTSLDKELFWFASYNRSNPYMQMENAIIWQFSDKGTVNGITSKVDLNVAKASFAETVVRVR